MRMSEERPSPLPEGELIKLAQIEAGMSARQAAELADISESRWRQIVSGVQRVSRNDARVEGPAVTVARMARAVGLTPERLAEVRPDAAEELKKLEDGPSNVPTNRAELKRFLAELAEKQADLAKRTRQALLWLEESEKRESRQRGRKGSSD
jgi:hypothetical protein